ncbi:hypothetical protein Tsp_03522 [Trichinella spiralis]|uniref:hypothetical protein n=1 Tax=Trichinella spiralis TaxID=6334 RepID=UPI0001EFB426|nr:hypothetical protein Tsp_03522 [Trichinella spiralis]
MKTIPIPPLPTSLASEEIWSIMVLICDSLIKLSNDRMSALTTSPFEMLFCNCSTYHHRSLSVCLSVLFKQFSGWNRNKSDKVTKSSSLTLIVHCLWLLSKR